MSFYPNVDGPHKELEELIRCECEKYDIQLLTVPQYYYLDEKEVKDYKNIFTNESLLLRSAADLFLVGKKYTTLLDLKTTHKKNSGNISIELSSFYWALQHSRDGVEFHYCSNHENKLIIFSPRENAPDSIFIQPRWEKYPEIKKLYYKYAEAIQHYFKRKLITIYNRKTDGSNDPFILKNYSDIQKTSFKLYLENQRQKLLYDFTPVRVPFMEAPTDD